MSPSDAVENAGKPHKAFNRKERKEKPKKGAKKGASFQLCVLCCFSLRSLRFKALAPFQHSHH
jgi:hypothetical protein